MVTEEVLTSIHVSTTDDYFGITASVSYLTAFYGVMGFLFVSRLNGAFDLFSLIIRFSHSARHRNCLLHMQIKLKLSCKRLEQK
jgi:hypothetical protein